MTAPRDVQAHSAALRVMHWANALAMLIMIGSGWRIYNWDPIFPFVFPDDLTIGGDPMLTEVTYNEQGLAGALQWHFAAMWLLIASYLCYLAYGLATGHFRRSFLPLAPRAIVADLVAALRLRLAHRLGHYNAVQRAAYVGVVLVIALTILSGLAIWKPVQLQWLTWTFGGFASARVVHFLGMAAIVLFLAVHLALTALVPRTLVAMIVGRVSSPAPAAGDDRAAAAGNEG